MNNMVTLVVMVGLVPTIHALPLLISKTWVVGTGPTMTGSADADQRQP